MGRRVHAPAMLPGMPDTVGGQPAKAETPPPARTLDEAITRSRDIICEALDQYPIVARQALVSGGNDSTVLLHLVREYLDTSHDDAVVHVNTGIGVPETNQYVRDLSAGWNLPLRELHPRDSYDDLVLGKVIARTGPNAGKRPVWLGFPGPAGHSVMYRRLKDEPLMRNRAQIIGKQGRSRKVMYLAGMRWGESQRRFRNAEEIDADGAIIWVSPIVHWTNAQMNEYRRRFDVPRNEVAAILHMSGECECGAYAKEDELEELGTWFPETAYRIRSLEKKAADLGIRNCKWGRKPAADGGTMPAGMIDPALLAPAHQGNERLCSSCQPAFEGQTDLLDTWVEQGLLSADAAKALSGEEKEAQ